MMKKIFLLRATAFILSMLMLFLCLAGCTVKTYNDKPISNSPIIETIVDGDVTTDILEATKLNMSKMGTTDIRTRKTSPNTRLVIDRENPLFLFHACNLYNKSFGERLIETYQTLPEDIRNFSAVYADEGTNAHTTQELLVIWEQILTMTDAAQVPIFIQVENWNSHETRDGFTQEQLSGLLARHPSLMGYVHVELSCTTTMPFDKIERLMTTIQACQNNNAIFVWQEMEYAHNTSTINRALDDAPELYDLMTAYSHNIVIQDKHNGQGRHFASQSAILGTWLADVCGNWGSNVESWIWWEEGMGDYNDLGDFFRGKSDIYTLKYPTALAGIDTICDMIAGATVYSFEQLFMYMENRDGKIQFTEGFWTVLYPLYQCILNGDIPDKEEVKEQIKVAYQIYSPNDKIIQELEAPLLLDLYAGTTEFFNQYKAYSASKKWVPTSGRYFCIPFLPKYVNASDILPNASILDRKNLSSTIGSTIESKVDYFHSKYPETYSGNGTLFSIHDVTYFLNNLENQTINSTQTIKRELSKSGITITMELREHTYAQLRESNNRLNIKLTNMRLDTSLVCEGLEDQGTFFQEYMNGKKMDSDDDFRTTVITLQGFDKKPIVHVAGSNNANAQVAWNSATKEATVTIISNGFVELNLAKQ